MDNFFPPTQEIVDAQLQVEVLPAFAASLLILALTLIVFGSRRAVPGAALGLIVGLALGNYLGEVQLDYSFSRGEDAWYQFGRAGYEWLPWAALLAFLHGLMARTPGVPTYVGGVLRLEAAAAATLMLVPGPMIEEHGWLPFAFAAVVLAEWILLEVIAYNTPGGDIPLALAIIFLSLPLIIYHTGFPTLMVTAAILGGALIGIVAVTWLGKCDSGGIIPVSVVMLNGMAVSAQYNNFGGLPAYLFVIMALAPLALLLMLLPPFYKLSPAKRQLLHLGLVLVPVLVALGLAYEAVQELSAEGPMQ